MPNIRQRAEGQLWIDRKKPHGLRYRVDGETFQVETVKSYMAGSSVDAGCVVVLSSLGTDSQGNEIAAFRPAEFPKDLGSVLGVCPRTVVEGDEVTILQNGFITLDSSDLSNILVQRSGDFDNGINYKGAPVYWFIGRTYKDGNSYGYMAPEAGKITLSTPSGMKWGQGPVASDNELNVGYSNLPMIGTVADLELSNGSISSLKISLNVNSFDSILEWYWPYSINITGESSDISASLINTYTDPTTSDDQSTSLIDESKEKRIVIRHGLFPGIIPSEEPYYAFRSRCFCDIIALNKSDDTETQVLAGVDNFYGASEEEGAVDGSNRRTEIIFKNSTESEEKRINVFGKVSYGYVKQYN